MKKLLILAVMAVRLATPASAWSGADQNGDRVEIDPDQTIDPGREIEFHQGGELRTLYIESVVPSQGRTRIEGRDEDGYQVALDMEAQDRREGDQLLEED